MKTIKNLFTIIVTSFVILTSLFVGSACGEDSNKIKLYFDGGGGSGNYNTTRKYSELEKLASEWNQNNDTFEIIINEKSLNGNRSSITSMLQAGTAPDMLMQVGGVKNDDIGNGWYVSLNEYLDKPNPYQNGNTAWKDIYGVEAISSSKAVDGNNYYVCLDNIAIGMVYNVDILNAAGIQKVPSTYKEFIDCLKALKEAKEKGNISSEIYCPSGLWNENYIGTSIYGGVYKEWDTDNDGSVSTKELVSAYNENKWSIEDERFQEYLRLLGEKAVYYPKNYLGFDVTYKFAKGELAITDAIGNSMVTLAQNAKFNVQVTGYPQIDSQSSKFGGQIARRGSAGFSSAYWITNSAVAKGDDAVNACVDFLMFLSESNNNARLVNNLGTALPLDIENSNVELFSDLVKQYKEDVANSSSLPWSACYIPEMLGTSFNDKFQLAMGLFYEDPDGVKTGDASAVIATLKQEAVTSINELVTRYGWK